MILLKLLFHNIKIKIAPDINIVPSPRKIEIGKPGNILLCFKPVIVIPVPTIIAIEVNIMTIKLPVWTKALEASML